MAYTDNNATAWGRISVKVGEVKPDGTMQTTLSSLGIVKENSIQLSSDEGNKKEWKAVGGELIDSIEEEGTLEIAMHIKNLNKTTLEKFWKVNENTDKLEVMSRVATKPLALRLEPEVQGAEITEFPKCSVSAKPVFAEDSGWGLEVKFKVLKPASNKASWIISRKA